MAPPPLIATATTMVHRVWKRLYSDDTQHQRSSTPVPVVMAVVESPSLIINIDRSGRGIIVMPTMLACSAIAGEDFLFPRRLCEDRKGFFDHLTATNIFKSTMRVTLTHCTATISHFYNEQFRKALEWDSLVDQDILTREEADEELAEWSKREWHELWTSFRRKLVVAFGKFHSVVLVMRLYEHVASFIVSDYRLDKLTVDTFALAQRMAQDNTNEHGKAMTRQQYGISMFHACWNANLIAYLADYSIHQVILLFGYYMYVRSRQTTRKRRQSSSLKPVLSTEQVNHDASNEFHGGGPLVLSLLRKSTMLILSRGICLGMASAGGAVGSLIQPGWGTLIGTNLGDGIAIGITDDLFST